MMNIYVQIKQQMNELSANEKKVAEYILAHPTEVVSFTAEKLAESQYVSKSTVYRFCDKLKLAALAMRRAKQIDVYSSAGNVFFAENFAFQMQEIGVSVQVPVDEYHQRLLAAASDKSHLAMLITFEGRGKIAKNISDILNLNP